MELELGGREEGPLEVTSEAGGSWEGASAADNLLGGLASKSLPQRRGGVGQKNGQPEGKKTVLVFDDFPNSLNAPVYQFWHCLLYTSPSPRDQRGSRMPSSA